MFFWIVYKIHIFMQCARQNPYEFFLHEYVNFVHGTEKPYRSLSIKIYIFMQCAPKSFSRISRLDSMAKCASHSDQPSATGVVPGVYQKWRKFKYSCTARTLCSISTDTGNSYWYHPCSCALCGLPKVYSWIPTVYLNSELRFPVFT